MNSVILVVISFIIGGGLVLGITMFGCWYVKYRQKKQMLPYQKYRMQLNAYKPKK